MAQGNGLLQAMYAEQKRLMIKEGQKQRGFFLRKKNQSEEDVKNQSWEDVYKRNMMKLSVMMLLYVFYEDDGDLSKFEYKRIKKFFKTHFRYLTKQDFKDIEKFFEERVNIQDFMNYMDQNEYEISIFNDATDEVSKVIRYSGKYMLIIHDLRKAFINR
jgi:hypothetical protein